MKDRPSPRELIEEMKKYKSEFTKEQFDQILGRTGEEIHYKDWLTGQNRTYFVAKSDIIMEDKCPIDGSPLNYVEVSQRWHGYVCINCGNTFDDLSPEGLKVRQDEILKENKSKLEELKIEKSRLERIVKRLEKK